MSKITIFLFLFFFKKIFIFFLTSKWTILTILLRFDLFANIAFEISFFLIGKEWIYFDNFFV